jgi:hypothetical protein
MLLVFLGTLLHSLASVIQTLNNIAAFFSNSNALTQAVVDLKFEDEVL